jgi:predicted N-acetyltransferase YhbS
LSKLIEVCSADELNRYDRDPSIPAIDQREWDLCDAGAHWAIVDGNRLVARASLWWNTGLMHGGRRVGLIGRYAASAAAASVELLAHACSELGRRGCALAVGPMDGDTMHRYRFVTERGDEPPFLLEPDNPDEWPAYWRLSGFAPLAEYWSSLNSDLSRQDPRVPEVAQRLERSGIEIRTMRPDSFEDDLRLIYAVSAASFQTNFLYTPFSEEQYLAQYVPYKTTVDPSMVWIAEHAGRPVGFLFAIPDLLRAMRGLPVDTLILKTVAVLPGRAHAGLGNVLVAGCHRAARDSGYTRVIHALMYAGNNSLNISNRFSRRFRRYTLFARELSA